MCDQQQDSDSGVVSVVILGSTGSIGMSALEVIRQNPGRFELLGIVAGSNAELLQNQVAEFKPRFAALASVDQTCKCAPGTELLRGPESICQLAAHPDADLVIGAIVGFAGLPSIISAVKAGKRIALANKESLVCAGDLLSKLVAESGAEIIPVDSEHSAIFQLLQGEELQDLRSVILTASGGPFLSMSAEEFSQVTVAQALNHPRWKMGPKISVDSATMVNKALELIEAHFLFDLDESQIEILIHPQSIVHSLVRLVDGSQLAQLSVPDMRGAIAYAMNYPQGRISTGMQDLDLASIGQLSFLQLDQEKFRAPKLARQALLGSSAMPAIFNFANEFAVQTFLDGATKFSRIVPIIEEALLAFSGRSYDSYEELSSLKSELFSWFKQFQY